MDHTAYASVAGEDLRHRQSTSTTGRPIVAELEPTLRIEETTPNEAALHSKDVSSSDKREPQRNRVGWWWWWEIGSSLLSITSIGLVFPILQMLDDKPLDAWGYSIRPNSLISILTTISKSSMTALTASCLGQLKWDHFQYRPNPLDHLQVYDDASRGPWGSFLLLCTGRLKVLTAWGFALVTLFALALEPSAQQILETSTRQSLLPNVTAQIGIARNYSSKGLISSSQFYWGGTLRNPTPDLFSLQTAIARGIAYSVPSANFYCPPPSTRCEWPPFSTLAVCSNYSNLTNIVKPDCTTNKYNDTTCNYRFSDGVALSMSFESDITGPSLLNSSGSPTTLNGVTAFRLDGIRRQLTDLSGRPKSNPQPFSITWNFCIKKYAKILASPTGIHTMDYTSVPLLHNDSIPAGIQRWNSFSHPSTDIIFNLTASVQTGLWQQLNSLLSREIQSHFSGDSVTTDFSVGEFMLFADLANMTSNIEETLSNQIMSSSPGDNEWAEMWPGQAFYEETYWQVHWSWITLPVVEVFLATLLLAISIVVTRSQPLFKSSTLALLYHGLESIDQDTDLRGDWENDLEELENRAKYVNVELKKDAHGALKFVKAANYL